MAAAQNSAYEIGGKAYKPDTRRDQWSSATDFIYTSLGHAFKMDVVTFVLPFMFLRTNVWAFLLYLLCVAIFVVPIFLLQSFLGQFSSSAYISVFRIAPIFKGIGYISLVLNYAIISYQSIFAGTPMLFLKYSMRMEMPWSCEHGHKYRSQNITDLQFCDVATTHDGNFFTEDLVPSLLFMSSQFKHVLGERYSFSWSLYACVLFSWIIVYAIVKQSASVFGKIVRYLVLITIALLIVCLLRSLFLPGSLHALRTYFDVDRKIDHWRTLCPVFAATTFGAGWGSTISMASFNKFDTNIVKYSWLTCGLQVLLMFLLGIFAYLMDAYLVTSNYIDAHELFNKQHWAIMLSIPSALTELEFPHFWCIIFCSMLVLAALVIISTHLFCLIAALLDEFSSLRERRSGVTLGIVVSLALSSVFFCFNHNITFFSALATDALFTQTALNLLLLLIVLWIYGRVRFQRDFEFMLGRPFATWLVYLLRFISPICGLFVMWACFLAAFYQHSMGTLAIFMVLIIFIALPWLFVPGYMAVKLLQTTGTICMRFRRIVRPTDWYPLQLDLRQRYIDTLDDMDLNQQLREINDNIEIT